MQDIFQFVLKHGYPILFAANFAHQVGLPIPGALFLLAAGALAAAGKLAFLPAVMVAVLAALLADWPWYELGRRRGMRVLHFFHRLSSDPDYHDRRAKATFAKYGPSILFISKFVPGLDAVAPPLAGISRTSRLRFLTFDAVGALLYSCAYAGLGYEFSQNLDLAATYVGRAGRFVVGAVVLAIIFYAIRKVILHFWLLHHPSLAAAKLNHQVNALGAVQQSCDAIEGPFHGS